MFRHLLLVSVCLRRQQRLAFLVLLREASPAVLAEVLAALKRRMGAAPPRHVVCSSDPTLLAAAAAGWPEATVFCSVAEYCRNVLAKVGGVDGRVVGETVVLGRSEIVGLEIGLRVYRVVSFLMRCDTYRTCTSVRTGRK